MAAQRKFRAHPESAPGDFYVVNGECISCGAPHAVAPDLIGWVNADADHCIWKKQPETEAELQQAFAAFDVCDVGCYRYAGSDPAIFTRIGAEYCDQAPPPPPFKFRQPGDPEIEIPIHLYQSPPQHRGWIVRMLLFLAAAALVFWLAFVKV